jgi:predicted CxxxxCH...CXXCH cytochrome family protein
MAATHRPLLCVALAALAAAGCDGTARTIAGHPSTDGDGCTTCHGDSSRVADSPRAGRPATGAHLAHLQGDTFRDPIACSECHPVPTSAAHVNQSVDFAFGPLASARGVTPSYVDASGTCTTACHGEAPSPAWTSDPTLGCASCHGLPPSAAPHAPTMSIQDCATCHPGTVLATGALNRSSKLHLDGKVDVGAFHGDTWGIPTEHGRAAMTELGSCGNCHGQDFSGGSSGVSCTACHTSVGQADWATDCTFCHGDPSTGRFSPPVDTQGRSEATNVSVGVHAAHVGTTIASRSAATRAIRRAETCGPTRRTSTATASPRSSSGRWRRPAARRRRTAA